MKLLLGTSNQGKIEEIATILKDLPIRVHSVADYNIGGEPDENGTTYTQNALIKARYYHKQSGLPCIADDSGIMVDALENELGIHTRRWGAGPHATDEEWIEYFLHRMKQEKNKRAHFTCVIAFVDEDGSEQIFEGNCSGKITETLEAHYLPGLPISACFKPDGYDKVFSALSLVNKNAISHRGKAALHFKEWLKKKLNTSL